MIDDYRQRAGRHAPQTIAEIRAAAQRLLNDGHTERRVAAALGCSVEQARRLIGECQYCA